MKRTFELDRWSGHQLVEEAAPNKSECTAEQLISFLRAQQERAEQAGLENIRFAFDIDEFDQECIDLIGEREETNEERTERETAESAFERRALLDYVAQQYRPKLRSERSEQYRTDCAVMIQQKGWDRLSNEELRQLAITASASEHASTIGK